MSTDVQGMLVRIEATTAQLRQELQRAEVAVGSTSSKIDSQLGKVDAAFDRLETSAEAAGNAVGVAFAGITAATAATVAGLGALIASTASAGKEIVNLSSLANASVTEFQRMAHGARSVGVDQSKLADILKDVNDRIGQFATSGSGEMAQFFEQIAPKVGVTIESFRKLSGPQALQLYYDSLEKAGLQQQDMTAYMEAMADEGTALIPLLAAGGRGFKEMGDRAEAMGAVLSQLELSQLDELSKIADDAGLAWDALTSKLAVGMLPTVQSLASALTDEGMLSAAETLSDGINLIVSNLDSLVAAVGGLGAGWLALKFIDGTQAVLAYAASVKAAHAAEVDHARAALAAAQAAARSAAAEVTAAQAHLAAAKGTDAQTAALSRLRLAKLASVEATNGLAAAQTAANAVGSATGAVARGVLGLLSGPAGLAALVGTAAAGWLLYSDNSDKARQSTLDLTRPIEELRKEVEALNLAQSNARLNGLQSEQRTLREEMAATSRSLEGQIVAYDKWGNSFSVGQRQRAAAWKEFAAALSRGEDIGQAATRLADMTGASEEMRTEIENAASQLDEQRGKVGQNAEVQALLTDRVNQLTSATRENTVATGENSGTIGAGAEAGRQYLEQLESQLNALRDKTALQAAERFLVDNEIAAESELGKKILATAAAKDQQREANSKAAEASKVSTKAARDEAKELQSLLDKLLPAKAAQREHAESVAALDKQLQAGSLTLVEYQAAMESAWAVLNKADFDKASAASKALTDELKRSQDAFEALEDQLDPVKAAGKKLVEQQKILRAELDRGEISLQRYTELLGKVQGEYDASTRATGEWAQWTESALERVDGAFADAWKGIGGSFDSFAENLKDGFRQLLAELAHMAITRPIVLSIGTALGVGGSAQALASPGGGSGGSLLSLAQNGYSLYQGATGQGFIGSIVSGFKSGGLSGAWNGATGYGSGLLSGLDQGAGQLYGYLSNGGGMTYAPLSTQAGVSGWSNIATGAAPWLSGFGGALMGYQNAGLKGAATGALGGFGGAKAGAALGAFAGPVGAAIGAVLGGLIGSIGGASLFGGSWQTKDAGLALQVRGGDLQGFNYEYQKKKGGLFGSDKKRYRYTAMAGDQAAVFDDMFAATTAGVFDAMSALGIEVGEQVLLGLNVGRKHFSAKSKNLEENIAKWFGTVADKATAVAIGRNRDLAGLTFEQLAELANALGAVNASLDTLNITLLDASPAGAKLAKQLQEMAGGMERLATLQGAYYDAYFSDAEKAADLLSAMLSQFGELGLSMPTTTAGFRALVEAQDLTTEAGQATYLALLELAPQMQALVSALGAVGAAAAQARDSALSSLMSAYNAEAQALTATAQGFDALAESLASFRVEVGQSLLALDGPLVQLDAARRQFAAASASAAGGDAQAMADLPAVGRQLAQAALAGSTSREEYARELASIQAATRAAEGRAVERRDVALEQLAAIEGQLTALGVLNESVLSVAEALAAYKAADAELQQVLRDQLADGFGALSSAIAANDSEGIKAAVRTGFNLLDTNLDGLLTVDELRAALSGKATDAQLLQVIASLDANGDGMVSAIEAQQQATVERLEYVAGQLDLNRSGTIGGLELVASRYAIGTDALAAELKVQMTDLKLKTLTQGQLQAVLNVPAKDIAALLAVADANHDEVLTQTELDAYRNKRIVDLLIESGQLRKQIADDFALIDSNLDGKLTANELQKYLKQELGVVARNDGLKALIQSVDASGNGTIERLDLIAAEVKRQNAIDIANLIGESDAGKISDNALAVFGAAMQTATPNYGGYAGVSEAKLERALARSTGLDRSEFSSLGFADLAALAKNLGVSKGFALSLGENVIDGVVDTATVEKLGLSVARLLGDAITARTSKPAPVSTDYSKLTEDKMEKGIASLVGVSQGAISLLNKTQLSAVAKSLKLDASYFPAFARGGLHAGGIRLVGEEGPELEVTGPSRIYSASQTAALLSGGAETAAEVRTLRAAVAELGSALRSIAKHTQQTARRVEFLERWDYDGLPEARTA